MIVKRERVGGEKENEKGAEGEKGKMISPLWEYYHYRSQKSRD